jgi:hypothetical protein
MSLQKRLLLTGVAAAILCVLSWETAGRVHVVRHWSLYAASSVAQPYRLFLDPFPDARTCDVERAKIVDAGGRAYCGSRLALSFDRDGESRFFWEFFSPANPWSRLCGSDAVRRTT